LASGTENAAPLLQYRYLVPLRPKYLSQHSILKHTHHIFLPHSKTQLPHPHKTAANTKFRTFESFKPYNPFSVLCLTRDFIRQGHAREKRKVYRATRTRSKAIDRG